MASTTNPIFKAAGVTKSERYLNTIAQQTFLSLWSYAGIFRDQADGKEICDLLVVFENHLLVFSDKFCKFPDTGNIDTDWRRWFKKAVWKSAHQIWGAERWIMSHPNRIFVDTRCTQPFPLPLPNREDAIVHRIAVAHGAAQRCKDMFGGSGSLMLHSDIVGNQHFASQADGGIPFAVGVLDSNKGFVHVLDDTSLDIVLGTVDTITDFVNYLTKKEALIENIPRVLATGEEDLLAAYLIDMNDEEEHDFNIPPDIDGVLFDESYWQNFVRDPQRLAQVEANKISYAWDQLIETFSQHILNDTQYYTTKRGVEHSENIMRFLAREPRTRRRMLAQSLIGMVANTPASYRATKVILPSNDGDPYYVFLLLSHLEGLPIEDYREVRYNLLADCCMVTKLNFPEARDIVGIAMNTKESTVGSEDAIYFDAREWSLEQQKEARKLKNELGLLTETTMFKDKVLEYPLSDSRRKPTGVKKIHVKKYPRNKPCPCGSGKKYKKCCGSPT